MTHTKLLVVGDRHNIALVVLDPIIHRLVGHEVYLQIKMRSQNVN